MDLSIPGSTTNSPLSTPSVFADNVQDLLGTGALHVNKSAIITVNSIADVVDDNDGVTTLREAINQANADSGEDLIVFDRSVFSNQQTITLSGTELDITHNLDIIAPRDPLTGGDLVTVSGNKALRVFEIEAGATVSIDGLIVADGQVTGDDGGGIKNSGTLTLDSSIVQNNSATRSGDIINPGPGGNGGGIFNTGNLTVNNSTLRGNLARTTFSFYNPIGQMRPFTEEFGNGGGIYSTGTIEVSNSTISANSTAESGGGIKNSHGTSTVLSSIISGNSVVSAYGLGPGTGGGISNNGTLNLSNSTISGNSVGGGNVGTGGGISNSGTLNLSNSTLSGNSADRGMGYRAETYGGMGGGIYNSGNLLVCNSTFSGNSAAYGFFGGGGGGIYNGGNLTLVFSTLTGNQGDKSGGVFNATSSDVSVRNTIIAANFSTSGINSDISGKFTSNGYNLIGDSTGSTGFGTTGDIVGTSDNPIDPRLAPLDFNSGTTQTIALLQDSPAIGAADPTVLDTDPTTDQRGLPRRASDCSADIGAFEFST